MKKLVLNDVLCLFYKATLLGYNVTVQLDKDDDWIIQITEQFNPEGFRESTAIDSISNESFWNKGSYHFDNLLGILNDKLQELEEEKIRQQKRKELIARLTDEEKDLLGVK